MLDLLLAEASARWPTWFPGESSGELVPMLLAGGPAHRDRVSVMHFVRGERRPRVIMKIGFSPVEGNFLVSEFEAMDQLRPLLPEHLRDRMPRALDLIRDGGATVLASEAIEGRRLLVSRLTGEVPRRARRIMDDFYARSFEFSRHVADATQDASRRGPEALVEITENFAATFAEVGPGLAARSRTLGRMIIDESIQWNPAWQHQDVAVGNVLDDGDRLRFVDWEHASADCPPWFDVAFAPVITSHLAMRMDQIPSVKNAALSVLDPGTAIGSILERRMKESWDYPISLSWAVALAAMVGAMRRVDEKREGSTEWAELVWLLLCDDDFRSRVGWLSPQW